MNTRAVRDWLARLIGEQFMAGEALDVKGKWTVTDAVFVDDGIRLEVERYKGKPSEGSTESQYFLIRVEQITSFQWKLAPSCRGLWGRGRGKAKEERRDR